MNLTTESNYWAKASLMCHSGVPSYVMCVFGHQPVLFCGYVGGRGVFGYFFFHCGFCFHFGHIFQFFFVFFLNF